VEAWAIFLIIFGVIAFIIIIASIKGSRKKKQPEKDVRKFIQYGDFISAGKLYVEKQMLQEAADLYFQLPPEKRPAYEAMVRGKLGPKGAQGFWIKAGRRYAQSLPEQAKIAFLLAGAYFDAVKMYIDQNDLTGATEIIGQIPSSYRETTVRRLSQYAFNRGKYQISAELLRTLGFEEEADSILAVAAHEFGAIQKPQVASSFYDSVGRRDLVGESQEQLGEKALSEGRIKAARTAFEAAVKAYDESNQPKDAVRVEERLGKFDLLDTFRQYAADGNASAAESMIDEIADHFPRIALSDLYAEIGTVLEKNGRTSEAVTYFDKAADSTNNPLKKQTYVNALRRLSAQIAVQPSQGETIAQTDLRDKCIVCRRPIRKGQKYVACPHCHKFAHYSHLLEWIKVQGSCPHCHNKLKVRDIKGE
jgi:tetratricopeptide (TPR) repeat protein